MRTVFFVIVMMMAALTTAAQDVVKRDVIATSQGDLEIFFIGHASLMMTFGGKIIHVDPYGKMGNYWTLPRADLVLFTHDHNDHFDLDALQKIQQQETVVILPPICSDRVPEGWIMTNGESLSVLGIHIQAVPAFNVVQRRDNGELYHPPGIGNGYVLTFADRRIYIAGDTENIAAMKSLKHIDCAFLPMSPPSTMTPAMAADAARTIKPKILYPYHTKDTDPQDLVALLRDMPEVEVRTRRMR
jgi:L-ascorbate metabolism protein UlaG (beta-lactamase superfamily)